MTYCEPSNNVNIPGMSQLLSIRITLEFVKDAVEEFKKDAQGMQDKMDQDGWPIGVDSSVQDIRTSAVKLQGKIEDLEQYAKEKLKENDDMMQKLREGFEKVGAREIEKMPENLRFLLGDWEKQE